MSLLQNYIVVKIRLESTAVDNRNATSWVEVDIHDESTECDSYHTVCLAKGKRPSVIFKRKKSDCIVDFSEMRKSLKKNFGINLDEFLA